MLRGLANPCNAPPHFHNKKAAQWLLRWRRRWNVTLATMTAGDVLPPDGTQSTPFRKVRGSKMGSKGRRIFTHGEANPQPCGDPTEKKGGRNLVPKLGPLITKYLTAAPKRGPHSAPHFFEMGRPERNFGRRLWPKSSPSRQKLRGRPANAKPPEFYNATLQSEQKSTD